MWGNIGQLWRQQICHLSQKLSFPQLLVNNMWLQTGIWWYEVWATNFELCISAWRTPNETRQSMLHEIMTATSLLVQWLGAELGLALYWIQLRSSDCLSWSRCHNLAVTSQRPARVGRKGNNGTRTADTSILHLVYGVHLLSLLGNKISRFEQLPKKRRIILWF